MQEPNETTQNPQPKQEICTLRIAFPVLSDEHALDIKRQITKALADTSDVAIQFSISNMPMRPPT